MYCALGRSLDDIEELKNKLFSLEIQHNELSEKVREVEIDQYM
jgi:hypothetical protein